MGGHNGRNGGGRTVKLMCAFIKCSPGIPTERVWSGIPTPLSILNTKSNSTNS